MAYGHLNPFMALARQIERRKAYTITIINTPLNIQKLKSSLPPNNTNITLVEIPFNVGPLQGLPPNVENTDTLSYQEIVPFMLASADLQAPFRNLLVDMTKKDGCPPLCIISDIVHCGAGYSMAAYFSISLNIHRFEADDGDEFFLPDFPEASQIQFSQLGNDLKYTDAVKAWWAFRERQFSLCFRSDSVLLNTIKGLEEIGVKYFSRKLGAGKSVWMIGPACSSVKKDYDLHSNDLSSWLDVHPPGSVLYASFGSQNALLPSQMRELALGLEASGKPFIWVIRPPIGFCATKEPKGERFPDGFEERIRTKNQGILIFKWAPQLEILSHKSTGAFLSHCGWNSELESLCQGVPIIG
ncbi:UDP-glycosyltransferase 92A1-like [Pistacia vera]|uniref:UDP-glycosyltransferase 92A1-like n=1 Tax=Pistacia vera TaxID=55513 RepID=UPI0012630D54|nr:UDP-glycosyltransferase 92A1-like [Pistacia vera]